MASPADMLWRINNEYQKRLKQAANCLGLLEQLVSMHDSAGQRQTIHALQHMLQQIRALKLEHREWRYQYYYESLDTRRIVQSQSAIERALAHFERMRLRHEPQLQQLRFLLSHVPRPDPTITCVASGDLWVMVEYAISDLLLFNDSLETLPEA